MSELNRTEAVKLYADIKKRFNLSIDRVVNYVNYGKNSVTFKLAGDRNDANDDVLIRQGNPFRSKSSIPAKEVAAYIQENYPQFSVTMTYGFMISGHCVPHVKIKCTQL